MATNKRKSADRRQVTILFADISGFTALSQRMEPDDVHETMNRCFDAIGGIIRDRGGTVDKYIGDCVMALFGAPAALEQAPRQALNAAIEIHHCVERLNGEMDLPADLGLYRRAGHRRRVPIHPRPQIRREISRKHAAPPGTAAEPLGHPKIRRDATDRHKRHGIWFRRRQRSPFDLF